MIPLYCFLAGVLSAALHALTLWWAVATMRPRRAGRALVVVWCGALLRSLLAGAVLALAASHSLRSALLSAPTFALTHLVLTRLISQRLIKSVPALPS